MILTLNPDGSATMTTDYLNGQPVIVETGTWQVNDDGTVTTSFTQVGENVLATPDVITFAQQDNALVAVEFDPEAYGSEGLTLVKNGEAVAGAPAPAEGTVPAEGATPAAPAEPVAPAEPAAPAEITGVTWQLQEISRGSGSVSPVADPTKYTLTLNADGTVAIVADCNTGAGTYEVDGSAISLPAACNHPYGLPATLDGQPVHQGARVCRQLRRRERQLRAFVQQRQWNVDLCASRPVNSDRLVARSAKSHPRKVQSRKIGPF